MRSYGQYCAIAKALDVVGDRWNLLIVRELLARETCRYTDLQAGLPGIATNLLAGRLRDLEAAGVVERESAPPPVATTLFRLTDRGRALKPVLVELLRWGAPLMARPDGDEVFRSHWLGAAAEMFLSDRAPRQPPIEIELRAGEEPPVTVLAGGGSVSTRFGPAADPALVLAGPPKIVAGVLAGELELARAQRLGLKSQGDRGALERVGVRPTARAPA